jgi:hypothetical protein
MRKALSKAARIRGIRQIRCEPGWADTHAHPGKRAGWTGVQRPSQLPSGAGLGHPLLLSQHPVRPDGRPLLVDRAHAGPAPPSPRRGNLRSPSARRGAGHRGELHLVSLKSPAEDVSDSERSSEKDPFRYPSPGRVEQARGPLKTVRLPIPKSKFRTAF